jgi:hypothetical protein
MAKRKKFSKMNSSQKAGVIISRILDPVIEIPLLLLIAASTAYLNGFRWRFLALIFFLDAVIPGIYFFYLVFFKKSTDIDMSKREDRIPLYKLAVSSHLAGVLVAFLIGREPLAQILLSFWLMALIFMFITHHYKISLHAGVNSMLATFSILLFGFQRVWWVISLPLLVSWARIAYKRHSLSQVILGSLLPAILLPFFFWVFKI